MRTKLFAPSLPGLRGLAFLGLLLAGGSVKAQTYDYFYSCTRFLDPATADPVTEYANYYTDASGNQYFGALPVFLGSNPDPSSLTWLSPGYALFITNTLGGLKPGPVKPLPPGPVGPGGGGGPNGGGGVPPGPAPPVYYWTDVNKTNGWIKIKVEDDERVGIEVSYDHAHTWSTIMVGNGTVLPPACYRFHGEAGWTGCSVTLSTLADGTLTDMNAVVGGGAYFPSSSPPSFYANAGFDFGYTGDSDSPFDGNGLGTAYIQCDADECESWATPEGYACCIPEPSGLSLVSIGAGGLLVFARRRRKAA